MKRFVITMLLCVTAINAVTKEELIKTGYQENWRPGTPDLSLAFVDSFEQKKPLTIKGGHVPAQGSFPRGTEVYVPTADGSYEQAFYRAPDVQLDKKTGMKKIFWTTVVNENNKNPRSVPTARLMVLGSTLRTISLSRRASLINLTDLTDLSLN